MREEGSHFLDNIVNHLVLFFFTIFKKNILAHLYFFLILNQMSAGTNYIHQHKCSLV